MEDLQKQTSVFSQRIAKSSFALIALVLASVVLIVLILAIVVKLNPSNSAQSITALVSNPALKDWSVTVAGTVKKVDAGTITISAKNNTFSFNTSPDTVVNIQSTSDNGASAIPSLQPYAPKLLHTGDQIQATIASTDNGPKTTVITVASSTAKINTSASLSGEKTQSQGFETPPAPPAPPKNPKSPSQSTSESELKLPSAFGSSQTTK